MAKRIISWINDIDTKRTSEASKLMRYVVIVPVFGVVGAIAYAEFQRMRRWRKGQFEGKCVV